MSGQYQKTLLQAIGQNEPLILWKAIEPWMMDISGAMMGLMEISHLSFSDEVRTAAIRDEGNSCHIMFNREFLLQNIDYPGDMAALLLHEVLHQVMGHVYLEDKSDATNIAQDAFINAVICELEPELNSFFGKVNKSQHPMALMLKPYSQFEDKIDQQIYDGLYSGKVSELEIWSWLQGKIEFSGTKIVLIGSHSQRGGKRTVGRVKQRFGDLKKGLNKILSDTRFSGSGGNLFEAEIDPELSEAGNRKKLEKILKNLLRNQLENHIIEMFNSGDPEKRVVPGHSRRDLALLAAGTAPVLYSWPIAECLEEEKKEPIQVYVDVSGSVCEDIPWVYGLLLAVEQYLKKPVKLFSTKVEPVTLSQLRKGEVISTGGTDFDCVARDIIDNKIKNALIITDGFADLSPALLERIIRDRVVVATVYMVEDYFKGSPLNKVSQETFVLSKKRKQTAE